MGLAQSELQEVVFFAIVPSLISYPPFRILFLAAKGLLGGGQGTQNASKLLDMDYAI
jgi:hypothetical protein